MLGVVGIVQTDFFRNRQDFQKEKKGWGMTEIYKVKDRKGTTTTKKGIKKKK